MRNFFKVLGDLLIEDVNSSNNNFYMVASKFTPWADEGNPDLYNDSYKDSDLDLRNEMIFGKKITSADVAYLIDRNTWTNGTVYDQYDHEDDNAVDKNFFVINTNGDVFKCLSNNKNSASTIQPTSKSTEAFILADGYKWKYMFTASSAALNKFGSALHIPYVANSTIISASTRGTIDNVIVVTGGANYAKYFVGQIQQIVGARTFKINNEASANTDFYENCTLYFSSGPENGKIFNIVDHFANSSGIYITANTNASPTLFSDFVISPRIDIDGDGQGFKAYSTVNTVSGKIETVNIISTGNNYTQAQLSIFSANPQFGNGAVIRPSISPITGHGSNPSVELSSEKLIFVTEFDGNESNTIPTQIQYRKYALIKDLKFANGDLANTSTFNSTIQLDLNITSTNTLFNVGELVVGSTSGAKGKIAFANTTKMMVTKFGNTLFSNNEVITSQNTNISATISNINNSTIDIHSGEILFYDVTTPVTRTTSSSEKVGFIISNIAGR